MNDRFDRVDWSGEPDPDPRTQAESEAEPGAIDEARENVLEGWPGVSLHEPPSRAAEPPAVDPDVPAEPPFEPFPADDAHDEGAVAGVASEGHGSEEFASEGAPAEDVASESGDLPEATSALTAPAPPVVAEPEPSSQGAAAAVSEHAAGELVVPPGFGVIEGAPDGSRRAVGVVVSRFNGSITSRLLESALEELQRLGVAPENTTVMPVPGAFELPIAAMALAKTRRFACIVALGCVVRGDTPHFEYVSTEAASGLQVAALETGVPVAFGVLTLDSAAQAAERVDKGAEAARTGLEMADLFARLRMAAAQ